MSIEYNPLTQKTDVWIFFFTEARAEILGGPDKHVKSGSTLELTCVLRRSTEAPSYVFWYHNDRMINYDSSRGVLVEYARYSSVLQIKNAQKSDSGNYTCVPSNTHPASIHVHILNGKFMATKAIAREIEMNRYKIVQNNIWNLFKTVLFSNSLILECFVSQCQIYFFLKPVFEMFKALDDIRSRTTVNQYFVHLVHL